MKQIELSRTSLLAYTNLSSLDSSLLCTSVFIMTDLAVEPSGWERALMAAEKINERLLRATRALDVAGVSYAVAGGNAVAEWVGVGLLDTSWTARLPGSLGARLQQLLDDPNG